MMYTNECEKINAQFYINFILIVIIHSIPIMFIMSIFKMRNE